MEEDIGTGVDIDEEGHAEEGNAEVVVEVPLGPRTRKLPPRFEGMADERAKLSLRRRRSFKLRLVLPEPQWRQFWSL